MSMNLSWSRLSSYIIIIGLAGLPAMAEAADLRSVENRLRAVEDRLEIQDLVTGKYATALDMVDPDAYTELFTKDAFLSVAGKPFKGQNEIRQMMVEIKKHEYEFDSRPATLRRWGPMRHVVTNPVITITGDTATSESYSTEIGSNGRDEKGHGKPQGITNVCRYEDSLVKQNGKWLFAKRLILCDMFGKRPQGPDTYPNTMAPSDVSP